MIQAEPSNLRHDPRPVTHLLTPGNLPGEERSDDAFVHKGGVFGEHAHFTEDRHHRGGSGAAGRAIDFRVREDGHVAQVRIGVLRRRGEDRAVDPFEPGVERMTT